MSNQTPFTCRWAFLSLSTISSTFITDLLLPRNDAVPIHHELAAVSTTGTKERANNWLAEQKVPSPSSVQIYQSWEEMLKSGVFDVVYVSTPHPLHYEHVMEALAHNRNVLVEKPATMNSAQFQKLADRAKQQNVVLMEAMWTRYLPATKYLQDHLLPRIGPVRRVFSDFSFPIAAPELPLSSRFLDKQAGAGSMLDLGVYALTWADIALNTNFSSASPSASSPVLQAARVVHADSIPYHTGADSIDDINTIILTRPGPSSSSGPSNSATGIVTMSLSLPGSSKPSFGERLLAKKHAPSVRIEAATAQVSIPFPPIRPQEIHVQWYGREGADEAGIDGAQAGAAEREEIIKKPVQRGWGMYYQADVIAQAVRDRRNETPRGGARGGLVIGGDETVRVLSLLDEARKLAGITYDPQLEKV